MKPISTEAMCLRQDLAAAKRRITELESLRDHLIDTTRAYQDEIAALLTQNSELRAERAQRYAQTATHGGFFLQTDPFGEPDDAA